MIDHLLISEKELAPYCTEEGLAGRARGLLFQQKNSWDLLRSGYASLQHVETRRFEFDGFVVNVQHNPGRLASTTALVDEQSIRKRPCFLCPPNLPAQQRGLLYGDYLVLCNPFPIFPEHFTLPHRKHIPQRILSAFTPFLRLSKELGNRYTVLYNGPMCGASAPDHLHFQAGGKFFLPVENEYTPLKRLHGKPIAEKTQLRAYAIERYLRNFIALESADEHVLSAAFEIFYRALQTVSGSLEEPMMNLLCVYDDDAWRLIMFPRAKHRPSSFFRDGEGGILISPAAIDLAGVCITPLERDFSKVTKEDIIEMYEEVSLPAETFRNLYRDLRKPLDSLH